MLTAYLKAAMKKAKYEILQDGNNVQKVLIKL